MRVAETHMQIKRLAADLFEELGGLLREGLHVARAIAGTSGRFEVPGIDTRWIYVQFADHAGGAPARFGQAGDGMHPVMRVEIVGLVRMPKLAVGMILKSGEDHGAAGAAGRGGAETVGETDALAGQAVEIRGGYHGVSVAARDRAVIVGYQQQYAIGTLVCRLSQSRGRGGRQELAAIQYDVLHIEHMLTRRKAIKFGAAALPAAAFAQGSQPGLTAFQIGCMTLPYSPFPLGRALEGIAGAGYRFVGWGTSHRNPAGQPISVMSFEAAPKEARQLATRCRDMGLEPVMMFSTVNVEAADSVEKHGRRIAQAAAAKIPYLITFGKTTPGEMAPWITNLKRLGPVARSAGVTLVIKQHGGNTATGKDCARIVSEVGDEGVKICYDAGNVLDYQNDDPIPDIRECWQHVRAFAIKDHRNTPKDEDCGPGFGEIDHYKLLLPVARTGRTIPLVCENIFEPLVPRPHVADGVDSLARRAREFLESVIRGIQA